MRRVAKKDLRRACPRCKPARMASRSKTLACRRFLVTRHFSSDGQSSTTWIRCLWPPSAGRLTRKRWPSADTP